MAEPGFAFIGAVHGLLQSSKSSQKADVFLAAVLQALFEADRSVQEIAERVHQFWPGAIRSHEEVEAALELGRELTLIGKTSALDGSELWTLTKNGATDVGQHVDWVALMRSRAVEDIQEKASTGLQMTPSPEEAALWLDRLVAALGTIIRSSQEAYQGNVDALVGAGATTKRVAPKNLDRARVSAAFEGETGPVAQFLEALTLAALDPLDPFGNELVSHITTGCILHAFVVGLDRQRFLKRIGPPTGQRAVLDTMVLIELLGPRRIAKGTEDTIRGAVTDGWEVVVLEHSLAEAQQVLHRDVPEIEEALRTAHANGTRQDWYASLTEDQLPALCVEVVREGTYANLRQLLAAADDLATRLAALGVTVRPHHNGDDPRVERLRTALAEHLTSTKARSAVVVDRDAHTMAMTWRTRRRAHGKWPGGWVITKDRAMSPVYAHVQNQDKVALTLTPGQWATLLAVSAASPRVEDLASAAAGQLLDEAMWTLPVRYPPETALELARQLAPEHGGSDTDLRVAQMTLDEALESTPTSAAIAGRVLSARTQRVNSITKNEADRLSRGLSEQKDLAEAAQHKALEAENQRLATEQTVVGLQTEQDVLSEQLRWAQERARRLTIASPLLGVAVVALVVALFVAGPLTCAFTAAGLLVLAASCWRWVREEHTSIRPLIVGGVLDLLGAISGILEIAGAL